MAGKRIRVWGGVVLALVLWATPTWASLVVSVYDNPGGNTVTITQDDPGIEGYLVYIEKDIQDPSPIWLMVDPAPAGILLTLQEYIHNGTKEDWLDFHDELWIPDPDNAGEWIPAPSTVDGLHWDSVTQTGLFSSYSIDPNVEEITFSGGTWPWCNWALIEKTVYVPAGVDTFLVKEWPSYTIPVPGALVIASLGVCLVTLYRRMRG